MRIRVKTFSTCSPRRGCLNGIQWIDLLVVDTWRGTRPRGSHRVPSPYCVWVIIRRRQRSRGGHVIPAIMWNGRFGRNRRRWTRGRRRVLRKARGESCWKRVERSSGLAVTLPRGNTRRFIGYNPMKCLSTRPFRTGERGRNRFRHV